MIKYKIAFMCIIGIIIIAVLFQSFVSKSTNETEQQKYSVVRNYKEFEIRFYPTATIATINSDAKNYKELSGSGFRKLANYIFGGNEASKNISMTAPVHMVIDDSLSTMSFVMPSDYTLETLPRPNDPTLSIKNSEEEYVAALRFGGFASDKDINTYREKLRSLLKENGITANGNYRYYGYNPPYQISNRRNEIVVAVKWEKGN
jgi:SOUL heme-binding protein